MTADLWGVAADHHEIVVPRKKLEKVYNAVPEGRSQRQGRCFRRSRGCRAELYEGKSATKGRLGTLTSVRVVRRLDPVVYASLREVPGGRAMDRRAVRRWILELLAFFSAAGAHYAEAAGLD